MRFFARISSLLIVALHLLSPVGAQARPTTLAASEGEAPASRQAEARLALQSASQASSQGAGQLENPRAEPQDEPDPVAVVRSMADAFNEGDVDAVVSYFGDSFQMTMRPWFPSTSDKTEEVSTREWVQELIDNDFRIELEIRKAEGNHVQTRTTTWQNFTRLIGMTPLVGIEDYVVEDGRITSLTWTASEQAWQDFYAFRNKVFIGLAVLGLVIVGVVWWLIRRRKQKRVAS